MKCNLKGLENFFRGTCFLQHVWYSFASQQFFCLITQKNTQPNSDGSFVFYGRVICKLQKIRTKLNLFSRWCLYAFSHMRRMIVNSCKFLCSFKTYDCRRLKWLQMILEYHCFQQTKLKLTKNNNETKEKKWNLNLKKKLYEYLNNRRIHSHF